MFRTTFQPRMALWLGVLAACVPALALHAAEIHVPADYPTIQAAIDASLNGDEIVVAPGTYAAFELNRNVTVRGSDGPEVTIVDGGGTSIVCHVLSSGSESMLQGLTLTNGSQGVNLFSSFAPPDFTIDDCIISSMTTGGAISLISTAPGAITITNSVFVDNSVTLGGGAIRMAGTDIHYFVTDCTFLNNSAGGEGGAIWIDGAVTAGSRVIVGCTFEGNSAARGGAISATGTSPVQQIDDCHFINNTATGTEGGGAIWTSNAIPLTNCQFTGNTATIGGGLRIAGGTVTDCTFSQNEAVNGGGMFITNASAMNCTFTGNSASETGGGMFITDATATTCTFAGNSANGSGGGVYAGAGEATVNSCTMTANNAGTSGGVYVEAMAILNIADSTLCMNTPDDVGHDGALLATNVVAGLGCSEADPVGACCLPQGGCAALSEANCIAVGGTYQGDGTNCAKAECPDPEPTCPADINGDGVVNVSDLLILIGAWGHICP